MNSYMSQLEHHQRRGEQYDAPSSSTSADAFVPDFDYHSQTVNEEQRFNVPVTFGPSSSITEDSVFPVFESFNESDLRSGFPLWSPEGFVDPVASSSLNYLSDHQSSNQPFDSSDNSGLTSEAGESYDIESEPFQCTPMIYGSDGPQTYQFDTTSPGTWPQVESGSNDFVGAQAKVDDIDKFLIAAGNAEAFDGNASIDLALQRLGLKSQYDLLHGMAVPLMPHQTIGVAWMSEKEQSEFKGGCLSDEMGLGKTVQMIAVIVKNQSDNPKCKTNLIIAPTSLLNQWKSEIDSKTNCGLKCLIYHGPSKPKREEDLLQYDVVLTTYMTMTLEWPDFEAEARKRKKSRRPNGQEIAITSNDGAEGRDRSKKRRVEAGLLFQVDFYRIILDEAQVIRNRRTRTSRAVSNLNATYRWCLTGTPIINRLVDVYGYLRFLKVTPWYDFKTFQNHVGILEKRSPQLAITRLQAILALYQLRRKKDSLLDGKRLIELPEKKVELIKLEFTDEEREVYKMVEAKSQATFNRYLKAGTVLKNYHHVLVLLLRLRQICSHPSLIQEEGAAFVSSDEVGVDLKPELATELTRARRQISLEFVTKMKQKLKEVALKRIEAEKLSPDAAIEDEDCPICFDTFSCPVVTPCTHAFCRECITGVLHTAPVEALPGEPEKYKLNERPCPVCREPVCAEKLYDRCAFEPLDAELERVDGVQDPDVEMTDIESTGKKRKRATTQSNFLSRKVYNVDRFIDSKSNIFFDGERDEERDERQWVKQGKRPVSVFPDSDDGREPFSEEKEVILGGKNVPASLGAIELMPRFLPSTKMKYMMDQLQKLFEERPEEKTMIVSQWTGCLSLVSGYLTEKGIAHVKYQGDMNRAKRDEAIRIFMSKDSARVMLMSLKCGGVGLNLTRANNVISLDLGWSLAVESQAYDRVHRLGQIRDVNIKRLVIVDTVEDRVLQMQEKKQLLSDGSLGEGSGKKIGKLTIKELANLFGL